MSTLIKHILGHIVFLFGRNVLRIFARDSSTEGNVSALRLNLSPIPNSTSNLRSSFLYMAAAEDFIPSSVVVPSIALRCWWCHPLVFRDIHPVGSGTVPMCDARYIPGGYPEVVIPEIYIYSLLELFGIKKFSHFLFHIKQQSTVTFTTKNFQCKWS